LKVVVAFFSTDQAKKNKASKLQAFSESSKFDQIDQKSSSPSTSGPTVS